MELKIFALVLFTLLTAWNLFLEILDYKAADNPVPLNVIDVYDRKTYKKWQSYHREKVGLSIVSMLVSFLVLFMLVQFDLFAKVSPEKGIYLPILVLVFFDTLVEGVIGVIFSFVNMTIEEKYGFNKSTMETFAQDQVKELVIGFVLNLFLAFALAALHRWLGDWILVLFAALMLCVMLLVSFLYPWLSKIFNHFTPLEDGELKDKLTALLTGHGYKVRGIMVMDASRRTTKSNAYFTGFGKSKTIVLYDTLLSALTTDEICAVFAHEMGHGLHMDTLKNQLINLGNIAGMVLLLWLHVHFAGSCAPFGFASFNYAFVMILVGTIYMPVFSVFYDILTSRHSRRAEFAADAQAVQEGYADALVSALKKINREDFGTLSPHPLTVLLSYSHPTLSQRITAIEAKKKEMQHGEHSTEPD